MTPSHDVVVLGAGPAGLATAAALASRGKSVVVLERRDRDDFRVGETLSPEVGPFLEQLGAWPALSQHLAACSPFTVSRSAWGTSALEERPSILHPLGSGWHVDRSRFDLAFADWVESRGVSIHFGVGTCVATATGSGFIVTRRRGAPIEARSLVDASGRGAPASSHLQSSTWRAHDRQVAILCRYHPTGPVAPGPGLVLESVEGGFWYSAPLADGTLLAVYVTDSDLLASLGRGKSTRFRAALATSRHTAERLRGFEPESTPLVFRSDSGCLLPCAGVGWTAVGDAAMATDPLGGNGVLRALSSAATMAGGGVWPGEAELRRRFSDYLDVRASYYLLETRFTTAPFWSRRRPTAPDGTPLSWRQIDLTLSPTAMIRWVEDAPPAAEAWLPPPALAALKREAAHGIAAHHALALVRDSSTLPDRRALVGLEWLLAAEVLVAM